MSSRAWVVRRDRAFLASSGGFRDMLSPFIGDFTGDAAASQPRRA